MDGIDLVDLEQGFRKDQRIAYIIGKEPGNLRKDQVIVGFDGKPGKTYEVDVVLRKSNPKPKRKMFTKIITESTEDNIERLRDCGLIQSRGVPLCGNCGELGMCNSSNLEDWLTSTLPTRSRPQALQGRASERARGCKVLKLWRVAPSPRLQG